MESLSEFIAGAVEFVVCGILFLLAVLSLMWSLDAPVAQLVTSFKDIGGSSSAAIMFFALAYGTGVLTESLARWLFEVLLDRITVRISAFQRPPTAPAPGTLGRDPGVAPLTGPRLDPDSARFRSRQTIRLKWTAFITTVVRLMLGYRTGSGVWYTIDDRASCREERERQRALVMSTEGPLATEVQGHLKRLRVERVYTLSMAVVALALAIRGSLTGAILCAIASLVLTFLVHDRLIRYAKAIVRCHAIVAKATTPDGGTAPASAVGTS
ncbi:MAG TPA: hypothetical protein PLV11_11010 [Phycicoccus elongatus]|jgi:hypothetical protein|nr:hypothetical protein [Phycicoccus elongatus]